MTTITVRFSHYHSRSPIMEHTVGPLITVGQLRALVEQTMANVDTCMMRIFERWYVELIAGEITEIIQGDEARTISNFGIVNHLTEFFLDGPMADSIEGVGQGLALMYTNTRLQNQLVNAAMAQLATNIADINTTLAQINTTVTQQATTIADLNTTVTQQAAAIAGLSAIVRTSTALNVLPSEQSQSLKTLRLDEQSKFDRICSDASLALSNVRLAIEQASHRFAFATAIVPASAQVSFPTLHSLVCQRIGNRTLRSSEPLSPKYHKWSMKVEVSSCQHFIMGLLPSLSSALESQMTGTHATIGGLLGGWGIKANGTVTGNWSIAPALSYKQGDVVSFSYDFANKRLTITNGTQKAEGTIPANDGEKLYPSVYFHDFGDRISFV